MKLDFMSNADRDLLIQNGDFVIGNATATQAGLIIDSSKGEFRNAPNLGVGMIQYLGDKVSNVDYFNIISTELAKDGIELLTLEIELIGKDQYKYNITVR